MVWNDSVRAALIQMVQGVFPVLELTGVVHLTSDQVAIVMYFIGSVITFAGLVFKKGQQPGEAIVAGSGSETAPKPSDLL